MPIQLLIFLASSAVLIGAALMVILSINPIRSALFLVLAFFASASIWILAEAEFLALVLVLVYVGAVMTLFLFVVMTLNLNFKFSRQMFLRYAPLGLLVVAVITAFLIKAINPEHFLIQGSAVTHDASYSNTAALGSVLYTHYVYPFELAGILLLVAIIAAITLNIRVDRNRKIQSTAEQIATQKQDRLRIIKMDAEKKS